MYFSADINIKFNVNEGTSYQVFSANVSILSSFINYPVATFLVTQLQTILFNLIE